MPEAESEAGGARAATARDRLLADGLVFFVGARLRTTRRWQAAMARAALRLYRAGAELGDLRLPVASALLELYGPERPTDEIANYVEAILPVELDELRALDTLTPAP